MSNIILITISAVMIAGVSAYLGSLMLQRNAVLTAGPLGHLAIPGAALALLYGFDISLGAFPFILLGGALIWYLEKKTVLKTESITAVIFATAVAISFLFLPADKAEAALVGNITNITLRETLVIIVFLLAIAVVIRKIFKKMVLITISEELAKIERIDVGFYKLLYFLLISIVVAFGVRLVGGLLTAALVAIPTTSAKNVSVTLSRYTLLAVLFAIFSAVVGVIIYSIYYLPLGPTIIVIEAIIFTFSVLFRVKE